MAFPKTKPPAVLWEILDVAGSITSGFAVTFMTTGELAQKIHVSRIHAWRLAKAGIVPATKKTKGGRFYFVQCPKLTRWMNYMRNERFRKKELSRAYERAYGSEKLFSERQLREHMKEFREASRYARKSFNRTALLQQDVEGYYDIFHESIIRLETVIDDWTEFSERFNLPWPKEIKRAMQATLADLQRKLNDFLSATI